LVTKADNPSSLGGDLGLFFHPGNKFFDILAIEQIRIDKILPEVDEVTMRIDESRQECFSAEIDDFLAWSGCPRRYKPLGAAALDC